MKTQTKPKSKFRGFYTALALSLVMIGAACVFAYRQTSQTLEQNLNSLSEQMEVTTTATLPYEAPVVGVQTDVAMETETTVTATSATEETAAPETTPETTAPETEPEEATGGEAESALPPEEDDGRGADAEPGCSARRHSARQWPGPQGRGRRGRGLCCALAAFSPWGLGVRGLRVWGALWPFWAGCAVFLRFGLNSSIENLRIVVFPGWCLPSAGTGSPQKRLRSMYFKSGCSYA